MLTVDSVFSRVMAALASLSSAKWRPSIHTFDAFPLADGGSERCHKTYSVATPVTVLLQGRQQGSNRSKTLLRVRWLYRIRPTDRDDDYQAALVAEAVIRNAVLATGNNPEMKVHIPIGESATRTELVSPTGPMLMGELPFVVLHTLPLA